MSVCGRRDGRRQSPSGLVAAGSSTQPARSLAHLATSMTAPLVTPLCLTRERAEKGARPLPMTVSPTARSPTLLPIEGNAAGKNSMPYGGAEQSSSASSSKWPVTHITLPKLGPAAMTVMTTSSSSRGRRCSQCSPHSAVETAGKPRWPIGWQAAKSHVRRDPAGCGTLTARNFADVSHSNRRSICGWWSWRRGCGRSRGQAPAGS